MARRSKLLILAAVIVVAGVAVAVILSVSAPDRYAAFRKACLAHPGSSVVVLSTTTHGVAMGAPETVYRLGCRQATTGKITATYKSNRP